MVSGRLNSAICWFYNFSRKEIILAKCENLTVVNQRVTTFRIKRQYKNDADLIHALLNSSISLFLLMNSGFGRGIGVTDLTMDGISQSYFLIQICWIINRKTRLLSIGEK